MASEKQIDADETANVLKLKDSNTFPMWHFEIKILFRAKQLMDVVDGTSLLGSCGTDEEKKLKWKTKDATAQHAILRTVDRTVKVHLMTCESAKDMYDTLLRIYKKDTDHEKCLLLQEFYDYKLRQEQRCAH